MCTAAPFSISSRIPLRAPSWVDLADEAQPRRTYRSGEWSRTGAPGLISPFTVQASASGAPAIQLPILRRIQHHGNPGMTARIEPSLFFDATPNLEN